MSTALHTGDEPGEPPPLGKIRDTEVRRGSIRAGVRQALWAKTAGRCTLCNRRLLGEARSYWHSISAAQMAHIVGAKPTAGSPRGRELHGDTGLEDEDNLLLLCHDCHRTIDDAGHVDKFTPAKLRQLKRAHEDRIELATSIGILTRTAVIRLGCDIRGSHAVASRKEVADALFDHNYLGLVESQRSGHFDCTLAGEATDDGYWQMARSEIARTVALLNQGVAAGEIEHMSVFAIAPIPALVLLGASLDDKVETRLWQKHRDAGWQWPTNDETAVVTYTVDHPAAEWNRNTPGEVVLVVSLSAEVDPSRLPADLVDAPRLTLRPTGTIPTPTVLSHEQSLREFAVAFRTMLAAAEVAYPGATAWHLVLAAPVTACVEAGRAFMREVQPPVAVYQRTPDGAYGAVLHINDTDRYAAAAALAGGRS